MSDLMQFDFGKGITLQEVTMNPEKYDPEVQASFFDAVKAVRAQLREAEMILEAHILDNMNKDNATKLIFKGMDGRELVATRKKGADRCGAKEADEIMKKNGFQPGMIGDYKFSPSWSKAKEARKLGGDIQLIIDEMFKESKETIVISEK